MEQMPMWCPPTPPTADNDVYIDYSLGFLYENSPMTEAQLPPIYAKKERSRNRIEAGITDDGCRPTKIMRLREESVYAPRSLFDRPSPALMKMRRDMKLHKYRAIMRPPISAQLKSSSSHIMKTSPEPDHAMDWLPYEDWCLLLSIQNYLSLPLNTMIISPGHIANWDMVADVVNNGARLHRASKHCRGRYETVVIPREEGKHLYDTTPKKQKKQKTGVYKTPQIAEQQSKNNRSMRTSQLYNQDKNNSFTFTGNHKYESVKSVSNKRTSTVKSLPVTPLMKNPNAALIAECGIQIENPLTPMDVAALRAERIAKEKMKHAALSAEQQVAARLLQQQQLTQQQQLKLQQQTQQQQNGQQVTANSVGSQIHQLTQAIPTITTAGAMTNVKVASTIANLSNVTATTVTTAVKTRPGVAMQDTRTTSASVISVANLQTAQRIATASLVSTGQASVNAAGAQKSGLVGVTVATAASGNKTPTAAQLQYYRQQQVLLRQQQLKVLQAQAASGQKVSVAVSATAAAQQRVAAAATLVKQSIAAASNAVGAQTAGVKQTVTRTVSDTEMAALIKRQALQQQAKAAAAVAAAAVTQVQMPAQSNLTPAQIFAQAGLQVQQAGTSASGTPVATLVKTANMAGVRTATPQQIRQLALHPQIIAQRKLPAQKVAQLAQVAGKAGVQTQLIVQQKSLPATMTVQQIQQVMKHVQPSAMQQFTHVSTGQAVSQSQVVLAKSPLQTRMIPVASGALKQTIQVVTASNAQLRQATPIQGKPVANTVRRSPGPSSNLSPGSTTSGATVSAGANSSVGANTAASVPNLSSQSSINQVRLQTIAQQVQQQQQGQQDSQPK